MLPADKDNSLDELARRLDQGSLSNVRLKRSKLANPADTAPTEWPEELVVDYGERGDSRTWLWLKRLLIGATAFFLVAAAVATYVIFSGSNLISTSRIDLAITGPVSLKAGEEANLQLTIVNRNNSALLSPRLLLDYPAGTRSSQNIQQELLRETVTLSDIGPGAMVNQTVRAKMFGQANTQSVVKATLEYRLANASAIFTKEAGFNFTISAAPINLSLGLPKEINSGRDLTLDLKIISNSPSILANVLTSLSYPPGFSFRSSSIPPTKDNNLWSLGDLPVGIEKHIIIHGVLDGQDEELKTFLATVGLADSRDGNKVAVAYGHLAQSIAIRRPFVGLNLDFGTGPGTELVMDPGERLVGQISWVNNTPDIVRNLQIKLALSGSIFDRRSVNVSQGFYRSTDNTIIWDKTLADNLATLAPGGGGNSSFSFGLLPSDSLRGTAAHNPQMEITGTISGERITPDNQSEMVSTEIHRTIRLRSAVNLAANAYYRTGPFTNSGPWPPKVGQKTTYTLAWSVNNPSNDLSNVTVSTILPPSVTWLLTSSPQTEKISYNDKDRQVTWELGSVPARTGFDGPARTVSFQVSFLPSLSQVNQAPGLSSVINLTGDDNFVGTKVQVNHQALSTQTSDADLTTGTVGE